MIRLEDGWRNLKRKLLFNNVVSCCAAALASSTSFASYHEPTEEEEVNNRPTQGRMDLATALAIERSESTEVQRTPSPVNSLLKLIEETDGVDMRPHTVPVERFSGSESGSDWLCCVCMEQSKGAAFIPCGHAFCRVCAAVLRENDSPCPICNRPVFDVLHIF